MFSQGQMLAFALLFVPSSLDSGPTVSEQNLADMISHTTTLIPDPETRKPKAETIPLSLWGLPHFAVMARAEDGGARAHVHRPCFGLGV